MITEQTILEALATVNDPDLKRDIVSLDMVQNINITLGEVSFTIALTTPACPLKDEIKKDCLAALQGIIPEDFKINIEFTSRVTSWRKDNHAILPHVKNIIAVASGKGGVGKSTVSVNLAIALAKDGAKVGLIDADIYGPSIPLMLDLVGQKPHLIKKDGKSLIEPIEKYGIKVLSIGFLLDDKQAVVWRGPMVSSALRQFVTDTEWGELDYLIIDLPPGTGDIHLTLVQTVPVTGAIIVTTPQDVALADAKKAIAMFRMKPIEVPVLGIIENMAYFTPDELPDKKYYIFGQGGGQKLSIEFDVPLLGEIPIVEKIREGGDNGRPVILQQNLASAAFAGLAQNTARHIAIRNDSLAPTQKVAIVNS